HGQVAAILSSIGVPGPYTITSSNAGSAGLSVVSVDGKAANSGFSIDFAGRCASSTTKIALTPKTNFFRLQQPSSGIRSLELRKTATGYDVRASGILHTSEMKFSGGLVVLILADSSGAHLVLDRLAEGGLGSGFIHPDA